MSTTNPAMEVLLTIPMTLFLRHEFRSLRPPVLKQSVETVARYNETLRLARFPMAIQTLFGSVPQEPNLLERLKAGIEKTRSGLVGRVEDLLAGRKEIDAD